MIMVRIKYLFNLIKDKNIIKRNKIKKFQII